MRPYSRPSPQQIQLLKDLAKVLFELADNEDSVQNLRRLNLIISPAADIFDKAESYLHPDIGLELGEFVALKEDCLCAHPQPGPEGLRDNTRKAIIEILTKL